MSLTVLNRVGGASGGLTGIIRVNGLGESDTVTASKGNKTLVGVKTQRRNPKYGLPEGYTRLKSIEATGTQRLDLGISVPHTSSEVYIKFKTNSLQADNIIAGHNYGTWSWDTNMLYVSTGNGFTLNGAHLGVAFEVNVEYEVTYTNTTWKINSAQGTSSVLYNFADGYNDTIFYGNGKYGKGILEAYELRNNGKTVRSLIPARRNSDGAVGAYDTITNAFFENDGTGEFVAGEESDIPEYVACYEISGIKKTGIWTVTATNGEKTATQNVYVEVIGQYEIQMDYKLWLYRAGDECEDLTGGWDKISGTATSGYVFDNNNLSITKHSDHITASFSIVGVGKWSILGTKKFIDVTGFSKACYDIIVPSGSGVCFMDVALKKSTLQADGFLINDGSARVMERGVSKMQDRGVFEVNIPDDPDNAISVVEFTNVWETSNSSATIHIYNAWLE